MKKYTCLSMCLLASMLSANVVRHADPVAADLSAPTVDESGDSLTRKKCCCPPPSDCCTRLQCRTIISDLDELLACASIPITFAGSNPNLINITSPGSYCLTNDNLNGSIFINADHVLLNLEDHFVRNVNVTGHSNIIITNGVIDGSNLNGGSALTISQSSIVDVLTVKVLNAGVGTSIPTNGILVDRCVGVYLTDCIVQGNLASGIRIAPALGAIGSTNVLVSHSGFLANGGDGAFISTGNNGIIFQDCALSGNVSNGVSIDSGTAANRGLSFESCFLSANVLGSGLLSGGANGSFYDVVNCTAEFNGAHGYVTGVVDNIHFTDCLAQFNTADGFQLNNAIGTVVLLDHCRAVSNAGNGFLDAVGFASTSRYVSCYAQRNVTNNYNPALAAPFNPFSATAAGVSYWYNTFA